MTSPSAWNIFYGQLLHHEAHVYARWEGTVPSGGRLAGYVEGPYCQHAKTLPARIPLQDLGPGTGCSALARAIVPDPFFWTGHYPGYYRVQAEIRDGQSTIDRCEQLLGLRFLGARGRHLISAAKRWVMRGGCWNSVQSAAIAEWHRAEVAMITDNPDDALCREASLDGTLLVARLDAAADDFAARLARLAVWPAVAFVLLDGDAVDGNLVRHLAPNLLRIGRLQANTEPAIPPWAQLALVDVDSLQRDGQWAAAQSMPVVARRRPAEMLELPQVRPACDALQRDLAPYADLAGYFV